MKSVTYEWLVVYFRPVSISTFSKLPALLSWLPWIMCSCYIMPDRSYVRLLEAFDWVLTYREVLPTWTQTIVVSKTVQTILKTQGLSRATPAAVQAALAAHAPLAATVADFQTRVLEHVEHEPAKLPAGATWLASSDIIESVFGQYKAFTASYARIWCISGA